MTRLSLLMAASAGALVHANLVIPGYSPNILHFPSQQLAAVVGGAKATDPGLESCIEGIDTVQYCVDNLPDGAGERETADCLCCDLQDNFATAYISCESYIAFTATQYTDDFSIVSAAWSICQDASSSGFSCGAFQATTTAGSGGGGGGGAGGGTGGFTPTPTATGGNGGNTAEPPACTSFVSLYSSCADSVRGFTTMGYLEEASCLCYIDGVFTTALDDYISVCGNWAKTANPSDYETYVELETFCAGAAAATEATSLSSLAVQTFDTSVSTTHPTTTTTSPKHTTTSTQKTVTVTPTTTPPPKPNAAGAGPKPTGGAAAWLAVVLPLAML